MILEEAPRFDAANVTHALSRLARMQQRYQAQGPGSSHGQQQQPGGQRQVFQQAVRPAVEVLNRLVLQLVDEMEAWDTTLTLWAYAQLDYYDRGIFDELCRRGLDISSELKPVDCACLLVAFGRFGHYHPELLKQVPKVGLGC